MFNSAFISLEVGPSSPTCLASQTLRKYGENRFAPTSTLEAHKNYIFNVPVVFMARDLMILMRANPLIGRGGP